MRVLIVEDDAELAESLHRGLEELGLAVDTAGDEEEVLAAVAVVRYDVIVLDVMLPGRDGFALTRELRSRKLRTPVLILTGLGTVEDKVNGLESGADDYLVKPFSLKELVARIRALARRHLPDRAATVEAGPIRLDTAAHRVLVRGVEVPLTGKEFAILEFFLLQRDRVLSRESILANVWDFDLEDGRNLVEVYMGRLRRKLQGAGLADPFTTIRGVGYRFRLPD
ncbi:MAG: response regulator transcription factor [Candidatus Dormibacteraeota bacterium]|uniref:Response regulator transcription factor n=1 Tax=Candidatus Dormiibacter inghamiae TaxID=3127013 RepID=A0A934NHP8_9BACT|nr:response regulator transcription factor [Candidatus Dormibacteraeota bacterium]MBJ7605770.1 response regulator transcription factor [Candidatus Dormibacteraeota bacterium]